MILVKLYTKEASLLREAGRLEFYGVPVTRPDGSSWIEFDDLGEPRPGQIRLVPAGIATGAEIKAIRECGQGAVGSVRVASRVTRSRGNDVGPSCYYWFCRSAGFAQSRPRSRCWRCGSRRLEEGVT
jgi:hypothetical protein